jgi:polyphenol oxidase
MQGFPDSDTPLEAFTAAMIREVQLAPAPGDRFCTIAGFKAAGKEIRAGISLAAAGDMALSRRFSHPFRTQLFADLGVPGETAFAVRQVHSKAMIVLADQQPEETAALEADGMITGRSDAFLTVTVSDCLPIFLVDRATGAFGLVHSGWKGTGIAREAIGCLARAFGTRAADISAAIGPGIGACCYTVCEERAAGFAEHFGADTVVRGPEGNPRLDLRRANIGLLQSAGVRDISIVSDCTNCSAFLGSFRRQGPAHFTLMLAYIGHVR